MIREEFLQSAVNIRRQYIKVSNNMNLYNEKAKEVIESIENSVKELESIQENIEKVKNPEKSISEVLKVITDVEEEGKRLESLVEPMNKEIEKLSEEENELYRIIKESHPNLTDDDIINSVQERLKKEGI